MNLFSEIGEKEENNWNLSKNWSFDHKTKNIEKYIPWWFLNLKFYACETWLWLSRTLKSLIFVQEFIDHKETKVINQNKLYPDKSKRKEGGFTFYFRF